MKTLTKEIRSFPERATPREGRLIKVLVREVGGLPDRALFWIGTLLFVSGALEIESLPE